MSRHLTFNLFVQIILIKSFTSCFVFLDDTLQEDDRCQFNETTYGICSFKCPQTEKDYRTFGIFPKLCSITDGNLLFCCIENINSMNNMENSNIMKSKLLSESIMEGNSQQKYYKEYDYCPYNATINGVCRKQCPDLNFPKYKLLLTEKIKCPVQNGLPLDCCINHLRIAYPPETFSINNTYREGDFCPYNGISLGICENYCDQNNNIVRPEKFNQRNPICSHQSDGTPIYCCNDYYFTDAKVEVVVPFAIEGDSCRHQESKWGVCKAECKKLKKFQRFGIIPTMCPYETGKQQLFCCPSLNEVDELEKYRNSSSGRIFYKKCQEYTKRRKLNRPKRRIHRRMPLIQQFYVGGWDIRYGQYPHMAAIGWTGSDGKIMWNCGGSLISDDYVMTAAHCTIFNNVQPDIIRIGDQYLDYIEDPNNLPQNFTISKIIKHPDYSYFSAYNDIALIKLNQSITETSIVRPACLWNDDDNLDDDLSTIALGYGSTEFGGASSRKLIQGVLTRYEQDECVRIYKKQVQSTLRNGILDTQLCAGDPTGKQDTCQGDSGGPLQYLFDSHYVYGITSVGQNCPSIVPGIYTRVSKYLDWIESVVWPSKFG